MIDFSELALETFQVLRAYGKDIVLYDENGNRVFEPSDARRFYLSDDNILVSVLEDGDNSSIKVYLSGNITIAEVTEFVTVLRRIATQFNVLFNVRKYNKQIVPRDFATQAAVQEQQEYSSMNIMEGLYGTSKSSYLKLENARMIVRHSARVKENMIGGRGRSIQSIFVENAKGERFLFPVNVLSGARAMTQHVNHGGTFADEVGQQIIRMAQDFSNLATVANHIHVNQDALPGQALKMRESIRESAKAIRLSFERMCRDLPAYIRESERITAAQSLTESPEAFSERVEMLRSFLMVEGVELADSVLETVCHRVAVEEDMRPNANPSDGEEPQDGNNYADQQQEKTAVQPKQPIKPMTPGQNQDSDDNVYSGQDGAFHEDEDMANADPDEELAEENEVIRAFEAWMDEFNPDSMFEGKSYKHNDDDEESADEKKKQDKERREERENKKRTDESVEELKAKVEKLSKEYADCDDFPTARHEIKAELDKAKEELAKAESLEEGKSFKRNKDEDADDKKKQDKQRRDDQKGKQERTDESVYGAKWFKNKGQWLDAVHHINVDDDNGSAASYGGKLVAKWYDDRNEGWVSDAHMHVSEGNIEEMRFHELNAMLEGKSFKRNKDDDADQKKKDDQKRREERRKEPVEEGKSFKRNDDEDGDVKQKRKEDQKRREERKQEPVEEGKSFKRNKDDDADAKKKEDQKRREEKRREPVEEAENIKKGAFHKWLGKSENSPITDADIKKGLNSRDPHARKMAQFAKNMEKAHESVEMDEGKSFKRNDEESKGKKDKHEERRKAREEKKRTDEAVSPTTMEVLRDHGYDVEFVPSHMRNNDDYRHDQWTVTHMGEYSDFPDVIGKVYDQDGGWELAARHFQKSGGMTPSTGAELGEGKSFKRNDDDDAQSKKEKDQERRKARDEKRRTDEGAKFEMGPLDIEYAFPFGGKYGFSNEADGCYYTDGVKVWKGERISPYAEDFLERSAANLIAQMKELMKAGALQEVDGEIDEASDLSFNDAKAELPQVKDKLSKMSPFHPDYIKMKARLNKLQDRLSRMQDDELDEDDMHHEQWHVFDHNDNPVDGPFGSKEEAEQRCRRGEYPKFTGRHVSEASDISFNDAKAELPDVKDRLKKMNPFHPDYVKTKARHDKLQDRLARNGGDEETDESYVSGTAGYSGDTSDVIEDLCKDDFIMPRDQAHGLADEVEAKDKDGHPVDQAMIDRMRTLAGLNKI
jgi:hypothetical protein